MAFSGSSYVSAYLCRCRISRALPVETTVVWQGHLQGPALSGVECKKPVLVPVWFPQQQNICAASYVCFLKVFLLNFLLAENMESVLQFVYVYNLCHLLVEQSLFPEFVFGTMLLTNNKRCFFNFYQCSLP